MHKGPTMKTIKSIITATTITLGMTLFVLALCMGLGIGIETASASEDWQENLDRYTERVEKEETNQKLADYFLVCAAYWSDYSIRAYEDGRAKVAGFANHNYGVFVDLGKDVIGDDTVYERELQVTKDEMTHFRQKEGLKFIHDNFHQQCGG